MSTATAINLVDYANALFHIPTQAENTPVTKPDEMDIAASEYRLIKAQIKALEEQLEVLKTQMIAEMDAQQVDVVRTASGYVVRYSLVESNRLDTARLKKDHEQLYQTYLKNSVSTRFQVA